jgi:hypothetical protein
MSNPNHSAHREAVAVAESARQVSKAAAGNSQSAHRTADIAYYKAVLASGRTNGIITGAYAALQSLGVDPGNSPGGDV